VESAPLGGVVSPRGGGGCMWTFILNEVRAKHKTYFRHSAWMKYVTYHLVPVLDPNYKQHILSSAKVGKVCYSLPELHVKSVYLNLFG
jgi:hypothetical protein